MTIRKTTLALAITIAALVQVAVLAYAQEATSAWGGRGLRMEVTGSGAELEFDCATGSITEPLPLDKPGPFRVKGTYTAEHGGPVRKNEVRPTRNATYSGTVEGDTLHLHIAVEGTSSGQDYVLTKGHPARLFKCK